MEDRGRMAICGARVWAGIDESPAEVVGRPVCRLPGVPAELAGLSSPDSKCSGELTALGLSKGWKFHW